MEILLIVVVMLVLIATGFFVLRAYRQKSAQSAVVASSAPREHEEVYEVPQIRMNEEGDLTDSFLVQMKDLKKYRDQIMKDENRDV